MLHVSPTKIVLYITKSNILLTGSTNKVKRISPSTPPWGTPWLTLGCEEDSSFTLKNWKLFHYSSSFCLHLQISDSSTNSLLGQSKEPLTSGAGRAAVETNQMCKNVVTVMFKNPELGAEFITLCFCCFNEGSCLALLPFVLLLIKAVWHQ